MPITYLADNNFSPEDEVFIENVAAMREESLADGLLGPDQNGMPLFRDPGQESDLVDGPLMAFLRREREAQIMPGLVTPSVMYLTPPIGRVAYHVSPPNDWSSIRPGAAHCWNGSSVSQDADKSNGEIVLRTCADGSTGVDEAEAMIGTVINHQAAIDGDAYFSWLLETKVDWQFNQRNGGGRMAIVVTVFWELWEWVNGQQATKVDYNNAHGDVLVFTDAQPPLIGTKTVNVPAKGKASNVVTRIPIPKGTTAKKYLAVLGLYHNTTTNRPAAAQSRLITTTWA